ncbi:hypothetical protein JCM18882A_04460 [Brevibacterium metallidurans]|uniref:Uncharacterized protein n=2 Tax=Brevibacterium metallidurans TaxID=1482676 RepID=A0ABN0SJ92_9MICO
MPREVMEGMDTTSHITAVRRNRAPRRDHSSVITLVLGASLALGLGLCWSMISIRSLQAADSSWLTVTDAWWSWALMLVAAALIPAPTWGRIGNTLIAGGSAVTVYYVIKAQWAIGYPGNSRGFATYFQADSFLLYLLAVIVAAPVLGGIASGVTAALRRGRHAISGP